MKHNMSQLIGESPGISSVAKIAVLLPQLAMVSTTRPSSGARYVLRRAQFGHEIFETTTVWPSKTMLWNLDIRLLGKRPCPFRWQ